MDKPRPPRQARAPQLPALEHLPHPRLRTPQQRRGLLDGEVFTRFVVDRLYVVDRSVAWYVPGAASLDSPRQASLAAQLAHVTLVATQPPGALLGALVEVLNHLTTPTKLGRKPQRLSKTGRVCSHHIRRV